MALEQIIAEIMVIPIGEVHDDLEFRNIGSWDSMTHMLLISEVERRYDTELTGDEIADVRTVGDIRKALEKRNITG